MKERTALVFGPVSPEWDDGAFFAPVTERLRSRGIAVRLIDTVAPAEASMTVQDLTDLWYERIGSDAAPDLICGNALGGAVALAYAARLGGSTPVLAVSGPGRSDATLARRLEEIADLAARDMVDEALSLLRQRIVPGNAPTLPAAAMSVEAEFGDRQDAARRLVGLRLLCDLDLSTALSTYGGPIVTVVGSDSQLVAERHAILTPRSRTAVFEGAGMRPHHDSPELLDPVLDTLLEEMGNA